VLELSKLAEADPEFYRYLQENDEELLEFDPSALPESGLSETEDRDGDVDMDGRENIPVLTREHLRGWQKSLLQVRSQSVRPSEKQKA
jgi:nucleolar complex protein 2